jgi:CheY-like chemotaxis protein
VPTAICLNVPFTFCQCELLPVTQFKTSPAGREVLALVKKDSTLKTIPIVVLSTSAAEADINTSYDLRANCYFTKPVDLDDFDALVKKINDFWIEKVKLPRRALAA